jgi:ABC-type nitrate/sulfonate/bicarbonate transport system permease component
VSRRSLASVLEVTTPLLALAALWAWSARANAFFFPPLGDTLRTFREVWLFDRVGSDLLPSLLRMTAGWLIAVVFGIGLGVPLGLSAALRRTLSPVVEFGRAIPLPALIPFALLTLGFGDASKVFLVALACVWFVLLNTVDGVRGIDPLFEETARVYGIGRLRRLRSVVVPAALPQIFAGVRLSLPIALVAMVVSEMAASSNGLGFFVLQSQRSFAVADMWSGIVVLGILGYVLNVLALAVERRVLSWHRGSRTIV